MQNRLYWTGQLGASFRWMRVTRVIKGFAESLLWLKVHLVTWDNREKFQFLFSGSCGKYVADLWEWGRCNSTSWHFHGQVFSLGCLFWECVCQMVSFSNGSLLYINTIWLHLWHIGYELFPILSLNLVNLPTSEKNARAMRDDYAIYKITS